MDIMITPTRNSPSSSFRLQSTGQIPRLIKMIGFEFLIDQSDPVFHLRGREFTRGYDGICPTPTKSLEMMNLVSIVLILTEGFTDEAYGLEDAAQLLLPLAAIFFIRVRRNQVSLLIHEREAAVVCYQRLHRLVVAIDDFEPIGYPAGPPRSRGRLRTIRKQREPLLLIVEELLVCICQNQESA